MQKNPFSSLRPFLFLLLAAYLIVAGIACQNTDSSLDPTKDQGPPDPNPVIPLRSAVIPLNNVTAIANGDVGMLPLSVPTTWAVNGSNQLAFTAVGTTTGVGSYTLNHNAFMAAASGQFIMYGDSMNVSVVKYVNGVLQGQFGLQAPAFGERFAGIAIDGKDVAIVSKTGPRSYFLRTIEVDYNSGWIAGGGKTLDNVIVLKTQAMVGRVFFAIQSGGDYRIESYELKLLGDKQQDKISESPIVDFFVNRIGFVYACSKKSVGKYDAFGHRTEITSSGRDLRALSVSGDLVVHALDGNDIRVFIEGAGERKKIHFVDPNPIVSISPLGNLGDVSTTRPGVWNLWTFNTGAPGIAPKIAGADSVEAEIPPIVYFCQLSIVWPNGYKPINIATIEFKMAD